MSHYRGGLVALGVLVVFAVGGLAVLAFVLPGRAIAGTPLAAEVVAAPVHVDEPREEPGTVGGLRFVHEFVSAVNAGDVDSASSLLCDNTLVTDEIARAVAKGANLVVEDQPLTQYAAVDADLTGTQTGGTVTGWVSAVDPRQNGGWCVLNFTAL
jgi:hypothetical protein